jgi:hypothetical protein
MKKFQKNNILLHHTYGMEFLERIFYYIYSKLNIVKRKINHFIQEKQIDQNLYITQK